MSEQTTLRDTFAAAAMTGMLRKLRPGSVFDLTITARQAFELADTMLRERARNDAPAQQENTAMSDNKTQRDVIDLLAETRNWLREVQIGDAAPAIDAGIAEIVRLRADVAGLRNGAVDPRETVPQPSLESDENRRDCDTGGGAEPVLWAVQFDGEPVVPMLVFATPGEAEAYQRCTYLPSRVVRLYGDPPPTLTDAEREAIQTAIDILTDPVCRSENKKTETLRALLARLGGGK